MTKTYKDTSWLWLWLTQTFQTFSCGHPFTQLQEVPDRIDDKHFLGMLYIVRWSVHYISLQHVGSHLLYQMSSFRDRMSTLE